MVLHRLIPFIFFAALPGAHADPTPSQISVPNLAVRIERMKQTCLERDWAATKCKFLTRKQSKDEYSRTPVGDNVADLLVGIVKELAGDRAIFALKKYTAVCAGRVNPEIIAKETILYGVDKTLKEFAATKKLNECERACLANCASSELIDYVDRSNFRSLVSEDILARGYGICQHFAHLSSHFHDELGLQSRPVSSTKMGHQFIQVNIDGKWFYSEPQSSRCVFHPSPQTPGNLPLPP